MSNDDPSVDLTVLVVDDEKEVADAYALRLHGFCDVKTAYGGEEVLSIVEESTIDVVLLDRHMPGRSGDDVLAELRDGDFRGRVIMVTAVDPGFDVLDLPFDDYLCKPVDREDVRAAIDTQRQVLAYDVLGEYFSAESKRAVVEAETNAATRADHDEFEALSTCAAELKRRAERLLVDDEILECFDRIARNEL